MGLMSTEVPVRLSAGLSVESKTIWGLIPHNLMALQERIGLYQEYFRVGIAIDEPNFQVKFTKQTGELAVDLGGPFLSDWKVNRRERIRNLPTSAELTLLGIMMYPDLGKIKERGIVVGRRGNCETMALALPGKYLAELGKKPYEGEDRLYPLDPYHDNTHIVELMFKDGFMRPIRPVGVLFEEPRKREITIEDATGSAHCDACGVVYPLSQVIAVHNEVFVIGKGEKAGVCTQCGKGQPIPYQPRK